MWPRDEHLETAPERIDSAAIQASCAPRVCFPPAITADSKRSRRLQGMPFTSKTVIGVWDQCTDVPARVMLKILIDDAERNEGEVF